MTKTYSEMLKMDSYIDRLKYLAIKGRVGEATFGGRRSLNQTLYTSHEWRRVKREIIVRDNGCDLALSGLIIFGPVFVHHINPITEDDIRNRSYKIFDPDNLVCCSFKTHQMIHFGTMVDKEEPPIVLERAPNDTCPWK